ncbi:MAG: phosphohistidine phosphatase SixA [Acidobacteria bacterium]|nr:phosphohistidine phosphatase SixA [Acidobacteriota bacterium]MCB9398726.1 phosphohistidine phosphatase SixA [Acidobacteriota bacterium]
MHLFIMRHAEAEAGIVDASRYLTQLGRQMATSRGQDLKNWAVQPTQILHSPYRRAVETATLLNQAFHLPMQEWDALTPDGNVDQILNGLVEYSESIPLLVSHLPLVENLCYGLCSRSPLFQVGTLVEVQGNSLFSATNNFQVVRTAISHAS